MHQADTPSLTQELNALGDIEFPGAAAEHRRAGRLDRLADELGSNYDHYHAFLAKRLADLEDPHPDPVAYREKYGFVDGLTRFSTAFAHVQDITRAEELLRRARAATIAKIPFDELTPHHDERSDEPPVLVAPGELAPVDRAAPKPGEVSDDSAPLPAAAREMLALGQPDPN